MKKCSFCQNNIITNSEVPNYYAADAQVCSIACQKLRIHCVESIDLEYNNPSLWDSNIKKYAQVSTYVPSKKILCGNCSNTIDNDNIFCKWCCSNNTIHYCSSKCQIDHWIKGHSDVCWRHGQIQN